MWNSYPSSSSLSVGKGISTLYLTTNVAGQTSRLSWKQSWEFSKLPRAGHFEKSEAKDFRTEVKLVSL